VRWGKNITTKEALNRAHTIVTQTVRENYRILAKSNDMTRLTTEMCESEQGILSCIVLDPKSNTILAPAKLYNKPINDVYSLIAIKKITESKDEMPSVDVGDGSFIVAEPIYLYSPDTKDRALNAIVLAQFQAPIGVYSTFEPLVEAALFAIFLSLMAYFLIYKMVSYPLLNLQEQIDAALKGDNNSITSPAKFAELETLAQVINFAISRSKTTDFSASAGNSDTTELEDTQYLKAIEEMDEASSDALLVLDKNKIVQFVGKALEELIGMRNQYARGQNISDACKDAAFAGTSIDLCENVIQSLGQTQKAQLDINGTMREVTAVAHKNSTADIRFIFIVVKMNG
jgi:methyl-accepting chemotaxis protein